MADRVQPLKFESTSAGGSSDDYFPQPLNPNEDAIEAAGFYAQNSTSRDMNVGLYRDASNKLHFKQGVTDVTLDVLAAAEANTGSNIGTGTGDVYASKSGTTLQFRKLKANDAAISIANSGNDVLIGLVQANIAHQSISGVGTKTHSEIDQHIAGTAQKHSVAHLSDEANVVYGLNGRGSTDVGNNGSGNAADGIAKSGFYRHNGADMPGGLLIDVEHPTSFGYRAQISFDYGSTTVSGPYWRTRDGANNTWKGPYKIWAENNDGSGSGLDADKLDGQEGSYYTATSNLTEPAYVTGSVTKTARPLFDVLRADRTAFLPAEQIIIEQSIDGGVTWTDAGVSDVTKRRLFTGQRPSIPIPLKGGQKSTDCMIRVTITGMRYNVPAGTPETGRYAFWNSANVLSTERYFTANEGWAWVTSNADRIYFKVERASGSNPNGWALDREGYMSGWSGGNYFSLSGSVFGGGTSQVTNTWNWRFTFRTCTTQNTFVDANLDQAWLTTQQSIYHLKIHGVNVYSSSNNLMYNDNLYNWDEDKNATFPAAVAATSFTEGGTTLASKYVGIAATGLGKTGNATATAQYTAASDWSNLPVGFSSMIRNTTGTAGGAPVNNWGYFTKIANRDSGGGWAGLWVGYATGQNYVGRADTSSVFATWEKLWTDLNDGAGSGLDADLLDGHDGSFYADASALTAHTGSTSNPHGVTAAQVGAPTTTAFNSHTGDSVIHITAAERTAWNAKQDSSTNLTNLLAASGTGFLKKGASNTWSIDTATYQPTSTNLTNLLALNTVGLVKSTGAGTWSVDTSAYITGITSSMVTTALGYTPYNNTNPNGYVNASGAASAAPVQSVDGLTGTVSLSGRYTPLNHISGINHDHKDLDFHLGSTEDRFRSTHPHLRMDMGASNSITSGLDNWVTTEGSLKDSEYNDYYGPNSFVTEYTTDPLATVMDGFPIGGPASIVTVNTDGGWRHQLGFPTDHESIYWRYGDGAGSAWKQWYELIHAGNIASYLPSGGGKQTTIYRPDLVTSAITANGGYLWYYSNPVDSSGAVAHYFDTEQLTVSGARLSEWRNKGTVKVYFDKDGGVGATSFIENGTAISSKYAPISHSNTTSGNPHGTTAAMLGLGTANSVTFGVVNSNGDVYAVGDVVARASGTPIYLGDFYDSYAAHQHQKLSGSYVATPPTPATAVDGAFDFGYHFYSNASLTAAEGNYIPILTVGTYNTTAADRQTQMAFTANGIWYRTATSNGAASWATNAWSRIDKPMLVMPLSNTSISVTSTSSTSPNVFTSYQTRADIRGCTQYRIHCVCSSITAGTLNIGVRFGGTTTGYTSTNSTITSAGIKSSTAWTSIPVTATDDMDITLKAHGSVTGSWTIGYFAIEVR